MHGRSVGWAVVLGAALLVGRQAAACSIALPQHEVDPSRVGVDTVPPSAPQVELVSAHRATRGDDNGSCDTLGRIVLEVRATDDATPLEKLGYRIRVVRGELPGGFPGPEQAGLATPGSQQLVYGWSDGPNRNGPLDVTLEVRTVDAAGNVSEPVELQVTSQPAAGMFGPGCSAGGAGPAWLALLGLLALRRRRP